MDVKTLVDAGPLIGWLNAADQWHHWSVATLQGRRGPLHTTEIVLGEACYHLGGNSAPVQALLTLVREGGIVLHSLWPRHLIRTQILMARFEQMDAADASLVVLSEQFPKAKLVTTDARHFAVYRCRENKPVPAITP
ncbi:MAG: DNA-binding protein [Opitutus sp.]|nr:DNA-binding protein [Opitutus sp.]